jgi:small-conductance mechanosensitive channel
MDWSLDLNGFGDWLTDSGPKVVVIVVLGVIGTIIARRVLRLALVSDVLVTGEEEADARQRQTLTRFANRLATSVIWFAVLLTVLPEAGVNITAFLTGATVVGVAVGFGAQTLVRDAISGAFIILERQYNVGDYVRINNQEGRVTSISLLRTNFRDIDGVIHTIPNGSVVMTSNYSRGGTRQSFDFAVKSEVPLERVRSAVERVAEDLSRDEAAPAGLISGPRIFGIDAIKAGSYTVEIEAHVAGELRPRFRYLLTERLMSAFAEEDVALA